MKISKTAVSHANEHRSDQNNCCKQFLYTIHFCYVIVHVKRLYNELNARESGTEDDFSQNNSLIIS